MKFNRKYKPELLASEDVTRPHLASVWLDVAAKKLVATQGHAIVAIPCEPQDGDKTGALTADCLREARRRHSKGVASVKARAKLADTGAAIHRRPQVTYPEWQSVMKNQFKRGDKGTVTFGVNPLLLVKIALALGSGTWGSDPLLSITVRLPEPGKDMLDPIIVKREYGDDEEEAIVMPARVYK